MSIFSLWVNTTYATFTVESESAIVDLDTQQVLFTIVFNKPPDFFTFDEYGRATNSFQYWIDFESVLPFPTSMYGSPSFETVIRGPEIYAYGQIPIRNKLGASSDPTSGGWGEIRALVPYELVANTLTFGLSLESFGDLDGLFSYSLVLMEFGGTTDSLESQNTPDPIPPIAHINGPYTVYVGDALTLDGNGSTDPDGDIVSYMWDLDDEGVFETDAGVQAIFNVSYTYLESLRLLINHTYTIHLKVIDNDGLSGIADSTLTIVPKPAVKVAVDIKPGGCPNPVNTRSSGVLPVAILGTADLDVTMIDLASIRLAGVGPLRSSFEDVAAPGPDIADCNCVGTGPDGFLDLTLKFATQAIIEAIGDVDNGEVITLELTGILYDPIPYEIPIEGSDCILIKGKYKAINKADINRDGVVDSIDFFLLSENWLNCTML